MTRTWSILAARKKRFRAIAPRGGQFSDADFVGVLREHHIRTGVDGNGCRRDNVFVERLWKSTKCQHVYLHAYAAVSETRAEVTTGPDLHDRWRPHSSLDGQTADAVYFHMPP